MTVPNTTNSNLYTADGATADFAYTFRILQSADLVVSTIDTDGTVTLLTVTTDYTLDGVESYTGGTVTLVDTPAPGVQVSLVRAPEAVQDVSLQSQGQYNASVVERMADLLTMLVQSAQDGTDLAIRIPTAEQALGLDLTTPAVAGRANALLAFDGSGNVDVLTLADLGSILAAGNYVVDAPAFTPGVTTVLTLTQAPGTVNNAWVYFDGGYQQRNTYSVSGTTLTLTSPVPADVTRVEVIQAGVLPINTPADGSVSTATIQNAAVTGAKVAAATLAGANLIAATITDREVADDLLPAPWRNFIVDGSAVLGSAGDYATVTPGTYGYGKAEMWKGALFGTTVAGTLTRLVTSTLGRTGRSVKWSAVTTTGSGIVKFRTYIEAIDAADLKNQDATCAVQVLHDVGSAVNVALNVYKADVVDNFGAVTVIRSGTPVSVASGVNTEISELAIAMDDCGNGVMVEIVFTVGAVTAKNFEITEATLNLSAGVTTFAYEPIAAVLARGQRYFVRWAQGATGAFTFGYGLSINAGYMEVVITFPVVMRIAPTLAVSSAAHFQTTEWVAGVPTSRAPTAIAIGGSGSANPRSATVTATNAAAYTVGSPANLHTNSASATLDFDARF